MTAPLADTIIPIANGVHRIRLPLPFTPGHVNIYLLRRIDGYLLIDCGMNIEASFTALDEARKSIGFEWPEVRQIVVTHMHPDHVGLAGRLRELSGAEVMIHADEAALLDEVISDRRAPWEFEAMLANGTPREFATKVARSFAIIRNTFPDLSGATLLSGGEELQIDGGALRVVNTPGHSHGHISLYDPERRRLFGGDLMIDGVTPYIGWRHDRDAFNIYLQSLDGVAELDIDMVHSGHGDPIGNHREWIRTAKLHHFERSLAVHRAIEQRPHTAHELIDVVWQRTLPPFDYRFAFLEVMAHVEHLIARGVAKVERNDGITRLNACAPEGIDNTITFPDLLPTQRDQ